MAYALPPGNTHSGNLDLVPFEEVVLVLARALGAAQAADHQDRHSGSHHQRHQTSACHNPMPHNVIHPRAGRAQPAPPNYGAIGAISYRSSKCPKCTIGKFGPASRKFVVENVKIPLAG